MRSSTYTAWLSALASTLIPVHAQTFTNCNPLTQTCPADPALGKSTTIDFTKGESDQFTAVGNPTYDSDGAQFTVAKSGDAPTLTSKFYIMFGHVEVVMKAAPGVGIVSTLVLQSDDLDEIDLEWLGGDDQQVQSNYFGKGQTTTYNRGAFHPNPGNHDDFHTYTVDWTADQIVWSVDGNPVRALPVAKAQGQYPQTPVQIKLGIWSGGDPSNPPGTVQWAGGSTDYSAGPYTMVVKSVKATDYSTGTEYTYGDSSGTWKSIKASGGAISGAGGANQASMSSVAASAPQVTDPATGNPLPFDGTHRESSSTFTHPSVWPWVPSASSTLTTSVQTSIAGLPSGWTVSDTGKVVPPSSASKTSPPTSPTGSARVSQQVSSSAVDSEPSSKTFDDGMWHPSQYHSADNGMWHPSITAAPVLPSTATTLNTQVTPSASSLPGGSFAQQKESSNTTSASPSSVATGGARSLNVASSFALLSGTLLGAILL